MILTSISISLEPPNLRTLRSCTTLSNDTCTSYDKLPTSSKKSVPPFAISKCPIFRSKAPVKEPFSCPKSSLADNSREIAPQSIATKGPDARLLLL